MQIESNHRGMEDISPALLTHLDTRPYKPTDPAQKFVRCIMATLLLAGLQPGEARAATSFELGPHYRLNSVIDKAQQTAGEPNWEAEPISSNLDTAAGNIQRLPLTLIFSKQHLKKELKNTDSIMFKVTATSNGHEHTVADSTISAESLGEQPSVNMHSSEKSGAQNYIDSLGILPNTDKSFTLPLSALGTNTLYVTKKHGKNTTTTSQNLADPSSKACGEAHVIETDIASIYAIKSLCKAVKQIRPFINNDPIVILGEHGTNETALVEETQSNFPGVINLYLPFKRALRGVEVGSTTPRHELAHVLFSDLSQDDQDALSEDYEALVRTTAYRIPSEYDVQYSRPGKYYDTADNEPIWALITESQYERELGNAGSLSGHPFGKPTEMFASSIAVYSSYGEQYVDHFKKLEPYQQELHRNLFKTITDILEKRAKATDPMDNITKLIPDYWAIYQALFCSKLPKTSA